MCFQIFMILNLLSDCSIKKIMLLIANLLVEYISCYMTQFNL